MMSLNLTINSLFVGWRARRWADWKTLAGCWSEYLTIMVEESKRTRQGGGIEGSRPWQSMLVVDVVDPKRLH